MCDVYVSLDQQFSFVIYVWHMYLLAVMNKGKMLSCALHICPNIVLIRDITCKTNAPVHSVWTQSMHIEYILDVNWMCMKNG